MGRKKRRGKSLAEEYEEKERSVLQELLSMLLYMAIVLGLTFLVITFVGQRTYVSGDSMRNTLEDGDNLIVDKITYRFSAPRRFDIIVFPFEYEEDTYYIKRIIGMPGETIQIADGKIYVDGEPGNRGDAHCPGRRRVFCAGGQPECQLRQPGSQRRGNSPGQDYRKSLASDLAL